jgi:uncharacterized membrane protein YkgB
MWIGASEGFIRALTRIAVAAAAFISVSLSGVGAVLAVLTSFVTLSLLVTTPEAWAPALRDGNYGFYRPSAASRLVLKDEIWLARGFFILGHSVRALQTRQVRNEG